MPRPASLTKAKIAAAALALADRDGLEGVSMRKLADTLGVGAMSLYNHIADKAELERLLLDAVVSDIAPPKPVGPWRQRIMVAMRGIRAALTRHPALVPLLLKRTTVSPAALRPIEEILAALKVGGFEGKAQLHAYHALLSYLTGAVLTDLNSALSLRRGRTTSTVTGEVLQLDPQAFPNLIACARLAHKSDSKEEFSYGLAALLAGLKP